ncbi:MAG: hypothetical protein J7M14_08420 [Planctomycetes bacterium]|nr:hypothetical protein [Planctomycetota bacterium]
MADLELASGDVRTPVFGGNVLRRNGRLMVIVAIVTLALELGFYAAARIQGATAAAAVLAALAVSVVWVALAGPILAASGSSAMETLLRGALAADASLPALVTLALIAGSERTSDTLVPFTAVVKIYCTLAAMALAGVAIVCCARSRWTRAALGVGAATGFMLLLAGPFWTGGLVGASGVSAMISAATVYCNSFYSITYTVAPQSGFVWHLAPTMYGITRLGDYAPAPQAPWWAAGVFHLCIAGMALGACLLRRRRRAGPGE